MTAGTDDIIRGNTSDTAFILTLRCPDRPGIVHAVTGFLLEYGANISASGQFGDPETNRFFMRVQFEIPDPGRDSASLWSDFARVGEPFAMTWELTAAAAPTRTLILVSNVGHCLNDLLFRWSTGGLHIDVPAIVSNHRDFERLAAAYDIPFHHLPVTRESKDEAEAALLRLVDDLDIQLVVLARYMQILSEELCERLAGRVINIHHSFLPSFKGARPYHQAHARGVKLIGATAHYVTANLDEGPIIDQDVARVDHTMSPDQLVRTGREIESRVLAQAVRWHAEQRVLLNGAKTIVFP